MTSAGARNWPGDDPLTPAERSCLEAARDPVMLLARNMVDMPWTSFITAGFRFSGPGWWYSNALLLSCLREYVVSGRLKTTVVSLLASSRGRPLESYERS